MTSCVQFFPVVTVLQANVKRQATVKTTMTQLVSTDITYGLEAIPMYWCFGCGAFRQAVVVSKVCKLLVYCTQA